MLRKNNFTIGRSRKLSPTHGCQGLSGPNYVSVNGNCYYIKETKLSIDDAEKYCQTAFGSKFGGRLYEPKDKATHDLVIRAANGISKIGGGLISCSSVVLTPFFPLQPRLPKTAQNSIIKEFGHYSKASITI
jgi:hypothetical protein